jgi:hypothetical protein
MKEKTVYVNQWQGKDTNDGTQALKIIGTANFKRLFLSDAS